MQKNVVLVVMDCCRKKLIISEVVPFICSQAEKGVSYEQHYSTATWTLPSHTTMFTGLYTKEHGVEHRSMVVPNEANMIAEDFQKAGYQTVAISNNPWFGPMTGLDRGFDYFSGVWYRRIRRLPVGLVLRKKVKKILMEYSSFLDYRDSGATRALRKVTEWYDKERNAEKPFFMVINFMELHHPYQPPEPFRSQFYKSNIPWMDLEQDYRKINAKAVLREKDIPEQARTKQIIDFPSMEMLCQGELAYLDSRLKEWFDWMDDGNTIWIYTSDHGDLMGDEDGRVGHRFSLHRNLLHVPLIIYNDLGSYSKIRTHLTNHIDLYDALRYFIKFKHDEIMLPFSRDYSFAEHSNPIPMLMQLKEDKFFTKDYLKQVERDLFTCFDENDQVVISKRENDEFYTSLEDSHHHYFKELLIEWINENSDKLPVASQGGLEDSIQLLKKRGIF